MKTVLMLVFGTIDHRACNQVYILRTEASEPAYIASICVVLSARFGVDLPETRLSVGESGVILIRFHTHVGVSGVANVRDQLTV